MRVTFMISCAVLALGLPDKSTSEQALRDISVPIQIGDADILPRCDGLLGVLARMDDVPESVRQTHSDLRKKWFRMGHLTTAIVRSEPLYADPTEGYYTAYYRVFHETGQPVESVSLDIETCREKIRQLPDRPRPTRKPTE